MGDQCAQHVLPDRLGRRAAPLSDDGARFSIGHRPEARRQILKKKAGCRTIWSPVLAAAATRWAFFSRSSAIARSRCSASKPPGMAFAAANIRRRSRAATVGVLHGSKSYVLQDARGQITETHSVAAGLDYPGVGPELSYLRDCGRANSLRQPTQKRLPRSSCLPRLKALFRRLESAHAIAAVRRLAPPVKLSGRSIIVNLSGRGDKDMMTVGDYLGVKL